MKKCFKCGQEKDLKNFYKHPGMSDGRLNKCKECTKIDVKKRTVPRVCVVCKKDFMTWPSEIRRGSGLTCSRACFYERNRGLLDDKFAVKSTYHTIHKWVYKQGGKASKCEQCGDEKAPAYHWSNKSQKYLQDMNDWWQLCAKCHHKYDDIGNRAWITRKERYENGFKNK